ncbi:unnamed protein product [Microthlaspi erraticum]|uniref:Cytochrome P450 n=1 Tax=Microthlaspi erraticum TaxID=1685480 RepID=A0A6D2JG95_9BRAS|nr:unnamed protein product [Microthlaspi erraticum]
MAPMITADFQYRLVATIILCFFGFLCLYLLFKKKKDGLVLPPSPPSLPIIGHLHYFILSLLHHKSFQPHKLFHKLSSNYGPLLHLRVVNMPIVVVSSASLAYEIFRAQDVNISSRNVPTTEGSLFYDTYGFVMAPYGEYFKFMKKLIVANMFGPHAQEQSRSIRAHELEMFYERLLDKARKKESVEISKEAMKLMGNIICKMSMGRSFTQEYGEAGSIQGLVTKSAGLDIPLILGVWLFGQLEKLGISLFKKDITGLSKKYDELLERILVEHKEKPNTDGCTDIMDVLLAVSEDENAEYKITRNHIKSLFVELLFGGLDTTVNSIQWTMAEIINNPIIIERLKEEIDSVVGKSRLVQEKDLPNLPYLQAVIKEALRLHPPAPYIPREFQQGCKIGGFSVQGKTRLVVNLYSVMRDPNVWEDPLEFKPERFLTWQQEERKEQALKYIPFGGGRRGCPASNLANMIVGTTIGMMVQCFDWDIKGEKVNMDEWYKGFNQTMAHPLTLTPTTRISTLDLET